MLPEWEYAEFILNMRMAAGLTSKELANRLKVPVAVLKGIERGESLPPEPDQFLRRLREVVKEKIKENRSGARYAG